MPHPGAVIDILTSMFLFPSSRGKISAEIDQPQIHDVHRNLRVIDCLQLLPDHLRRKHFCVGRRFRCGGGESKRIGVSRVDSVHGASAV